MESTCLFVGTSLTDPNLLRYLYRSGDARGHAALFVRQQEADYYEAVNPSVAVARERAAAARWQGVGVRLLIADYFSQVAQFVEELAYARALGERYVGYPTRIARWEDASAAASSRPARRPSPSARGRFAMSWQTSCQR